MENISQLYTQQSLFSILGVCFVAGFSPLSTLYMELNIAALVRLC